MLYALESCGEEERRGGEVVGGRGILIVATLPYSPPFDLRYKGICYWERCIMFPW